MALKIGARGDLVREVQSRLRELGFDTGAIDGVFGERTRRALLEFQASKNLDTDGVVHDPVLEALGIKARLPRPELERTRFRHLLLKNPNYFGNIKISPFQPVTPIASNTRYEELKCVGYNPDESRLEAVVHIKQEFGYGGDLCSKGTPEYVRFYVDWNNDGNWTDVGITGFTVHDIPGPKPLEYAVALDIQPRRRFCFIQNLPNVRAILSWNQPPPPGTPDFTPVWGNVKEVRIQIEPLRLIILGDLLAEMNVKLTPQLSEMLQPTIPIAVTEPQELSMPTLKALYADRGVPAHRYGFAELQKLVDQPTMLESMGLPGFKGIFVDLDINIGEIIDALLNTDGNTNYEELLCVGLDPRRDMLVGVLKVKLPFGYSGNLCTAGSTEYVAFWMDWGSGWEYAGTSSVKVHDLSSIPPDGVYFAVFLPVDLAKRRRPCESGPVTARVRAILSWQTPPPPANPGYVPVWGNREETIVIVKPGIIVQPGTHPPFIETVGGMDVTNINNVTGLANGTAVTAGFTAQDSPFGGEIIVTGHIANPPDISSLAAPLKYRVSVSNDGGATWQPLTNKFTIGRSQLLDGVWSNLPNIEQTVDAEGWYTYYEDLAGGPGNPQIFVKGNILARWQTAAPMTGLWRIRVEARNPAMPLVTWISNTITVRLDNAAPNTAITITSGGGPCADFLIGETISGTYQVTDEHFGRLTLAVEPGLGGTFTSPTPLPRTYPAVPTTGEAGTWSLDTSGMPRCGYVVRLHAWDRTIVNSGFVGRHASSVVGLCLRAPGE